MKLRSNSFDDGATIPTRLAFGRPSADGRVELSENLNPHLAWSDAPAGTRSFVVRCIDVDVPTVGDDVNRDGRTVPWDLPRTDFAHWLLVDIPADVTSIDEGAHCSGITVGGKDGGDAPAPMRHGINDYTDWFSGDVDMRGDYFGYDGPGPPWNDERVHHYHFSVYATDLDAIPVDGAFSDADLMKALEGHILADATIVGSYAIYAKAR